MIPMPAPAGKFFIPKKEDFMKKCKIIIMAALAVFAVAALAGCGNADNEETGSNPDSDNGVVEQIVTDAATGAKEVITDAATGAKEIITDAAKGIEDGFTDAVNGSEEPVTDDYEGMNHER